METCGGRFVCSNPKRLKKITNTTAKNVSLDRTQYCENKVSAMPNGSLFLGGGGGGGGMLTLDVARLRSKDHDNNLYVTMFTSRLVK